MKIKNKIHDWLRESNRYKHLAGGFVVGLCALTPWAALYAGVVAAAVLEFKDKLYGNKWDWIDFAMTAAGALLASVVYLILYLILYLIWLM